MGVLVLLSVLLGVVLFELVNYNKYNIMYYEVEGIILRGIEFEGFYLWFDLLIV